MSPPVSVPTGDDGTVQATFAATLVDEWVRGGVTAAVVCPGSRSTPLALALADRPELALHVRLDERSAGFFALGLAVAGARPVVVCTTSGTAAAELHPAVVEAHHARVPMLVCTADRPPELHEVGAPQTIDQQGLYGRAVRWAYDPGVAAGDADVGVWRSLARRALAESWLGPGGPGPVHLNLPFRDPLVGTPGPLPAASAASSALCEPGPGVPAPASVEALRALAGRRGVVVAGAGAGPPSAVVGFARAFGWPLLADPRSGCRIADPVVVAAADAILRDHAILTALRPGAAVLLGSPWASKSLAAWLKDAARHGAEVLAVDPWWRWVDPDRIVSRTLREEPGPLLEAVRRACNESPTPPAAPSGVGVAAGWLERWQAAEAAAQGAVDAQLAAEHGPGGAGLSEPLVGRMLLGSLPADARVVAASSMPVRELEWFARPLDRPPPVYANRGANGIDGVCSTALGMAAAGRPVVALVGDLAFLHDVSALVRPVDDATSGCTLVVLDNRGGAIFSFLPQAASLPADRFETLFGTPQAPDVAAVARGFGVPTEDVGTATELEDALRRLVGRAPLAVVRVRLPDRRRNVELHDRLTAAVHSAVRAAVRDVG